MAIHATGRQADEPGLEYRRPRRRTSASAHQQRRQVPYLCRDLHAREQALYYRGHRAGGLPGAGVVSAIAGMARREWDRASLSVCLLQRIPGAPAGQACRAALTARGESLAAFDERCIPSGGVAPPSNTPGILSRRALPVGRLARLGATPDFHHGLLKERRGEAGHPPGHPRLDDPDDPCARADARLRHLAAACGPQQRSVPRQSRIALPVAVPSGAGRQVEGRLAAHGEQSPGQVLPPHCLRPAAARTASGAVESGLVRRRQRVGGGMTFLHRLASVVRWLFHRNGAEQDLNDELQAFVDMAAADRTRDGAPPTEARRLAVLDLGWQVVLNGTSFAVRTGTDPAATTAAVRTA